MIANSNIPYPNNAVVIDCLAIHKLRIRFLLTIKTKNSNNKSILVVMKNPSKAHTSQSDKTVNNVIQNLSNSYSKIYITNLFPYYSTKANGLLSYFDDNSNQTIQFINEMIIQKYSLLADDILIGWGTNTIGMKQKDYDDIIFSVMNILLKSNKPLYYVHCCKCSVSACKNNQPQCTDRCSKKCTRTKRNNQLSCPIVRYPMHLELWNNNKTMLPY